jgi:hypothetical protein
VLVGEGADKWQTASFRVGSDTITTNEMTRRLGLSPSNARDLYRAVWGLKSGLPSTEPLESHLEALLDFLEPVATEIAELQRDGCDMDFFVGVSSETGSVGACLEAALLGRIAALGIDLALDLYPPSA